MIQPTYRAVLLAIAGFPAALLPVLIHPRLWIVWLAVWSLMVVVIALDAFLALTPSRLTVELKVPETLAVGERGRLMAQLSAPQDITVEILADLHTDFAPSSSVHVALTAGKTEQIEIPLITRRRGRPTVDAIWCRWPGPFGLVRRQMRRVVKCAVAVVPDLSPVRAIALQFRGSSLQTGVQVERFIGDGSEFDALKEYMPGLDHRAIDWKASARHRRLLCQEFRAERNHQIVLALDTGHLMSEPLAGISRLDRAISAALLLGYVSLRLGDRVGLFAFDRAARAWTEPQGGLGAFPRLRAATSQLVYTHDETNFTLGLAELSTRLRRRSLVVVFTEFVDTVTAELMLENMARLARRQLVIFVALRDPLLDKTALAAPRRLRDVYSAVVSADLARERERVLARLRRMGVYCIDTDPNLVSTQLLNRYLEIKRRELV